MPCSGDNYSLASKKDTENRDTSILIGYLVHLLAKKPHPGNDDELIRETYRTLLDMATPKDTQGNEVGLPNSEILGAALVAEHSAAPQTVDRIVRWWIDHRQRDYKDMVNTISRFKHAVHNKDMAAIVQVAAQMDEDFQRNLKYYPKDAAAMKELGERASKIYQEAGEAIRRSGDVI